jgi:hypothetical protein
MKQLTVEQVLQWTALARTFFAMQQPTLVVCLCAVLRFVYSVLKLRYASADLKTVCSTQTRVERIKTPPSIKVIPRAKARQRGKPPRPKGDTSSN